jgi:hypothetical protein
MNRPQMMGFGPGLGPGSVGGNGSGAGCGLGPGKGSGLGGVGLGPGGSRAGRPSVHADMSISIARRPLRTVNGSPQGKVPRKNSAPVTRKIGISTAPDHSM